MNTLGKSFIQALALVAIGGGVGIAANALRQDRLDVGRDYFPARPVKPQTPDEDGKMSPLPAHDLQTVTLEEAAAAFAHPNHRPGESDSKIFFIDARKDAEFAEGHVPGALQVDHYRLDKYLPTVLSMLDTAEKIIVYCNGGECEDSILVSHDLMDAKVPYEKIFLFEGGMKAWKDAQQSVE